MHRTLALSTAVLLASHPATGAHAQSASNEDRALADEIRTLREQNARIEAANARLLAKVEELEDSMRNDGAWLTEQRAADIRAVVNDVLADSATRDSLAGDGATAGYDPSKGFFLASADGNFTLKFRGNIQFRWTYSSRDIGDAPAAAGSPKNTTEGDAWGFEFRRVQFMFGGHAFDPSWTYFIQFQAARNASAGNNVALNDAYVEKDLGNGFTFRAGQFKSPFLREELVSATMQMAVDRSLVNDFFTTARSQGIRLGWSDDTWRVEGWYGDEQRASGAEPFSINSSGDAEALNAAPALPVLSSVNTGFTQTPTDYSFAGRVEWKPAGTWKQFKDFSSFRGEEFGLMLGLAGYAQQLRPIVGTNGATPDVIWSVTGDLSVDLGGASLFAMGVFRDVSLQEAQPVRGGGESDSIAQWGALAQAGLFVADDVEVFARYEVGNSGTDEYRTSPTALLATGEELSLLSVGVNWWPTGYRNSQFKLTTDFGYSFEPLVDFAASAAGWLPDYTQADGATRDGQWVIRSQLQFVY